MLSQLTSGKTYAALTAVLLVVYVAWAQMAGLAHFTPDSWSFYELAQTYFTDHFYQFSAQRSYFSDVQSAAFPFGYPTALAAVHSVFGVTPYAAIYLNIATFVVSAGVIYALANQLKLNPALRLALFMGFALYPWYVDEMLSGKSIPLTLLLFLSGLLAFCRGNTLLAGFALGLSVITRFDMLIPALLLIALGPLFSPQGLTLQFNNKQLFRLSLMFPSFVVALLPWVVYSQTHFGSPWVSDNSWVAVAAERAHVLTWPVASGPTVFDAPVDWLLRVLENTARLFGILLLRVTPVFCLFVVLTITFLLKARSRFDTSQWLQVALIAACLLASLVPYILTRYLEERYFLLFLLGVCGLTGHYLSRPSWFAENRQTLTKLAFTAMLLSGCWSVFLLQDNVRRDLQSGERMERQRENVALLAACQREHPDRLIMLPANFSTLTNRYGAETGNRIASLPLNFSELSDAQKVTFLKQYSPNLVLLSGAEIAACAQGRSLSLAR